MNQLQFRGKLQNGTFLISILGVETSLCIAHVLFPDSHKDSGNNVFFDFSSISSSDSTEKILSAFQKKELFCPFFKNYKAPFDKTLVLREFHKNGNLEDVLTYNDEIEELYLAFILKAVLKALIKVHSMGFCLLGIKPEQIEITDEGELVFPFYYSVRSISISGLLRELIFFKNLVRKLIKQLNFEFKNIDNSKFSNKFKDFLKSLFQTYGFEDIFNESKDSHQKSAKPLK